MGAYFQGPSSHGSFLQKYILLLVTFFFVIILDMFLNGRLMSAVTVENFKKEKMCLVGRLYGIVVKRMVGRICK